MTPKQILDKSNSNASTGSVDISDNNDWTNSDVGDNNADTV